MVMDLGAGPPIIPLLLLAGTAAYFIPTFIAFDRHHRRAAVLAVNLLLGWTLIGWSVALDMARSAPASGPSDPAPDADQD
ncbi:MAG: superinfection immunity protein [Candidatus Dormiibacterota bacterium]